MGYFTAPKLAFGPGAIEQLSSLGAERPAVLVDEHLLHHPATQRVLEELGKTDARVATIPVEPHPPSLASVERLVEPCQAARPDWIIAVGGGSTIDAGKALWVRFVRPELPLEGVHPLAELGLAQVTRFVAVPTTCGSGSEVSWVADLARSDGSLVELASRELLPEWALLAPEFLGTLPAEVIADSAADAIAHALESFVSAWSNPFSDAMACAALGAGLGVLGAAVRHREQDEPLPQLQVAATQAGLAAANAQLGTAHALAHALGSVTDRPHGRLVATVLPYVAEFNYPSARDRYALLAPIVGAAAGQDRSFLAERLRQLWGTVGLPRTLPEAGVPAELLRTHRAVLLDRAQSAPGATANPRIPNRDELGRLLDAATTGAAVDF
jgi:acetaldehyde dehydrogenase/alcohol dehydrogenase